MKILFKIVGASTLVILISLSLNVNVNKSIKTNKSLTSLVQSAAAEYSVCPDDWGEDPSASDWVKSEVEETVEFDGDEYTGYFCYSGTERCIADIYDSGEAPKPPKVDNDV